MKARRTRSHSSRSLLLSEPVHPVHGAPGEPHQPEKLPRGPSGQSKGNPARERGKEGKGALIAVGSAPWVQPQRGTVSISGSFSGVIFTSSSYSLNSRMRSSSRKLGCGSRSRVLAIAVAPVTTYSLALSGYSGNAQ